MGKANVYWHKVFKSKVKAGIKKAKKTLSARSFNPDLLYSKSETCLKED